MKVKTFLKTYTNADLASPGLRLLRVVHGLGRAAPHVAAYMPTGAPFSGLFVHVVDDNTCDLEGIVPSPDGTPFTAIVRVSA